MWLVAILIIVSLWQICSAVEPLDQEQSQVTKDLCGLKYDPADDKRFKTAQPLPFKLIDGTIDYENIHFPWTVYFWIPTNNMHKPFAFDSANRCSGVLISDRHFLTTASCLFLNRNKYNQYNNNQMCVVIGAYMWRERTKLGEQIKQPYHEIPEIYIHHEISRTIHPRFNPVIFRSDIVNPFDLAIIEINPVRQEDMIFRSKVPICMPRNEQEARVYEAVGQQLYPPLYLTISGFGRNTVQEERTQLKYLNYLSVVLRECPDTIKRYVVQCGWPMDSILCLKGRADTKIDRGGPVTYTSTSNGQQTRERLVGILTDSKLATSAIIPIRPHMGWIKEVVNVNYFEN